MTIAAEGTRGRTEHYARAVSRWPGLAWSQAAFCLHADHVGAPESAHLVDLFLSGAAGFRVGKAWDEVANLTHDTAIGFLAKYERDTDDREDLYTSVISRLLAPDNDFPASDFEHLGYDLTPCKIIRFNASASLTTYVVAGVENEARSKARRRASKPQTHALGENASLVQTEPEGANYPDQVELLARVEQALHSEADQLPAEDRLLYLLLVERGMLKKDAAAFLGWGDNTKATKRFQKLGWRIRKIVEQALGEPSSPQNTQELAAWGKILSRILQAGEDSASHPEKDGDDRFHRLAREDDPHHG